MCMMSRRLTTPPDLRDAYHDVVGIEDDGSVAADRTPQTDAGSRLARIERIRTIGDEPISYEQTYINQRDYPSFLELDSTGFIYQLLRTACSADIHTVEETIEVVPGHGPLHPSSKTADRSAAATRVLPSARLGRSLSGACRRIPIRPTRCVPQHQRRFEEQPHPAVSISSASRQSSHEQPFPKTECIFWHEFGKET